MRGALAKVADGFDARATDRAVLVVQFFHDAREIEIQMAEGKKRLLRGLAHIWAAVAGLRDG